MDVTNRCLCDFQEYCRNKRKNCMHCIQTQREWKHGPWTLGEMFNVESPAFGSYFPHSLKKNILFEDIILATWLVIGPLLSDLYINLMMSAQKINGKPSKSCRESWLKPWNFNVMVIRVRMSVGYIICGLQKYLQNFRTIQDLSRGGFKNIDFSSSNQF